jgi:hypothetical protein
VISLLRFLDEFREQGSPAPRYEFEEVVGYLSNVMKTYGRIALTRGFPPLLRYFTDVYEQ